MEINSVAIDKGPETTSSILYLGHGGSWGTKEGPINT